MPTTIVAIEGAEGTLPSSTVCRTQPDARRRPVEGSSLIGAKRSARDAGRCDRTDCMRGGERGGGRRPARAQAALYAPAGSGKLQRIVYVRLHSPCL